MATRIHYCAKCLRKLHRKAPRRARSAWQVLTDDELKCVAVECLGKCPEKKIAIQKKGDRVRQWRPSKAASRAAKKLQDLIH